MIRDLLASLRGKLTLLISSHILPEIEATCDRVLIINGGHIVASGTPDDLRRSVLQEEVWVAEVAGDAERLARAIAAAGPDLRLVEPLGEAEGVFREVRIAAPSRGDPGEALLGAFQREGLRVRSLATRKASLEDVFLAATRRSWDSLLLGKPPSPSAKGKAA
jgi:ABC-2 type transport system ATP-binding protein